MKLIQTSGRGAQRAKAVLDSLEERGTAALDSVLPQIRRIVSRVKRFGDRALLEYARSLDGLSDPTLLRVTREEMREAWQRTSPEVQEALRTASNQVRRFAQRQKPKSWTWSPIVGLKTGQLVRPLDAVGCYVPSGRHPLPSTLLMTVLPAQVAGISRIVVVSPKPALETLAAAHLLKVDEFYRLGGAHAVAALAYGTQSIPRVNKIVGPGNLYVTAAKRYVAFDCGIDMLAGPTEIVVTSDSGTATDIALDLVAQAEHDPAAIAVFITTRTDLARSVVAEVDRLSRGNPTARASLRRNGYAIVSGSVEEARAITNRLAPEHLTVDDAEDVGWVRNAGSVFVGRWSAQSLGDYISGPNHTLPTGGTARIRGGLSVNDFVKLITVQEYSAEGVKALGDAAARLARAEGLLAHEDAIRERLAPSLRKDLR